MIHDLHFLILTCLHKIPSISFMLSSEAIAINELGSIALKLHTYTTFFLLKFIFNKKLQVVVEYCFFFCLVYIHGRPFATIDLTDGSNKDFIRQSHLTLNSA